MTSKWYLNKDGRQQGPFSQEELYRQVEAGAIRPEDLVWSEGMENWTRAEQVKGLIPTASPPDSQLSQQTSVEGIPPDSSAQAAAGSGPPPPLQGGGPVPPQLPSDSGLPPPPPHAGGAAPPSLPSDSGPPPPPLDPPASDFAGAAQNKVSYTIPIVVVSAVLFIALTGAAAYYVFSQDRDEVAGTEEIEEAEDITEDEHEGDDDADPGDDPDRDDDPVQGDDPEQGDVPAQGDDSGRGNDQDLPPPSPPAQQPPSVTTPGSSPPTARFTVSSTRPNVNDFIALNAGSSSSPTGQIVNYHWDFGDGTGGPTSNSRVAKKYISEGTYTVRLTVTDCRGQTAMSSRQITVSSSSPSLPSEEVLVACFTPSNVNPGVGEEVRFDPACSSGDIAWYKWVFDEGTAPTVLSTPEVTSFRFNEARTYYVTLTIQSAGGEFASQRSAINVQSQVVVPVPELDQPVARFTHHPVYPTVRDWVELDASASSSPNGRIVTYSWNFGDGTEGDTGDAIITKPFNSPGTYNVILRVTDIAGQSAVTSRRIKIVD